MEHSKNMMVRARKRKSSHLKINFYHLSILDLEKAGYDIVITNFFFDQFSVSKANLILQHLKPKLKPNGLLIFSDFISTNHLWDSLINRTMYTFFQLTAQIRTNSFPPYNTLFSSHGFHAEQYKKISRNILATTYSLLPPN